MINRDQEYPRQEKSGAVLPDNITEVVAEALREDIGGGDCTAALIAENRQIAARVIAREPAILCGTAWFDEVFRQLHASIKINWAVRDGAATRPEQIVCDLAGPARPLLTGERTALNFLQLLSGTATLTREYIELLQGCKTQLLDTRKTLPGLRAAQKYAVLCGGGGNHRMGLYDAILIKENHIQALGSIRAAIQAAKTQGVPVATEVENLAGLEEALAAGADRVLLDNFNLEELRQAVALNQQRTHNRAKLEASGGIDKHNLRSIAETGIDFVSLGALTKHVRAIDFSMRFY